MLYLFHNHSIDHLRKCVAFADQAILCLLSSYTLNTDVKKKEREPDEHETIGLPLGLGAL